MMPRSLQTRLLLLALLAAMIGGGLVALAGYRKALHEASEVFDSQLARSAQLLMSLTLHADQAHQDDAAEQGAHHYQIEEAYGIWRREGGVWRRSLTSSAALPMPDAVPGQFFEMQWLGQRWRALLREDESGDRRVLVAQPEAARRHMAGEVAWHGLQPIFIGLPLLALVLAFALHRSLRPLRALAHELSSRAPDRLDPVSMDSPPSELRPALEAVNALMARVAETLELERRFTSDAAHELRTPLAALQAQLQLARMQTAGEAAEAMDKARHGAMRLAHLVDQLLQLARLDVGEARLALVSADFVATVREVCGELGSSAVANAQSLELEAPECLMLPLHADLARVLVRNLVDNALRYTPSGGRVLVTVAAWGEGAVLQVSDDGPGVPPALRQELGRRFHRLDPALSEGVGLGLSIVSRIAALHGARLAFEDGLGGRGLSVSVAFPG